MFAGKGKPKVINPRDAERRRSIIIRVAATAVVVVIAAAIGIGLIVSKDDSASSGGTAAPAVATDTGAFRVNQPAAPKATLTLFEDFQCPACKAFESQFGDTLKQIRANPDVAVEYKPIAILDQQSSTQYSTRSANASACVAESTATNGDFTKWLAFHDALYGRQPAEGGAGLTDATLTDLATTAGAPSSVGSCIEDGQYTGWVGAETSEKSKDNLQGTPQVEIDGKVVQVSTPAALIAEVNAAVAQ
ncbi:DsbA family protein [Williamsia herbipolensis]|uniref:DsbA family protein n=1 Tax=Williamsia herbipolensis TaxID=1603258 RepID=UPI0005F863C1|nr:thioredoxin domain-containing protein [Williamsia herbipolensis]MCX6471833.1 thioredoxin domain-containing protein [Mycobacteriales bacterium]